MNLGLASSFMKLASWIANVTIANCFDSQHVAITLVSDFRWPLVLQEDSPPIQCHVLQIWPAQNEDSHFLSFSKPEVVSFGWYESLGGNQIILQLSKPLGLSC